MRQNILKITAIVLCFILSFGLSFNAVAENTNSWKNKIDERIYEESNDKNEKIPVYVWLGFGNMIFYADKEPHSFENLASFRLEICGKYEDVDKFVIHFTADKSILSPSVLYSGDDTVDYKASWSDTNAGYDYIISSWYADDFEHILYYPSFYIEQAGKHNLSATAEVVYKNGATESLEVIIDGLSDEVIDINSIVTGDVNCDGDITASDARQALRISADLEKAEDDIMKLADMDANGKVTAADARLILRKSAGL